MSEQNSKPSAKRELQKASTLASYRSRVIAVLEYMWENIDGDIDVNHLADVAHFSPYHFHRIYREMMHETVYQTVRRLRLHYAARLLAKGEKTIESIAKLSNYSSVEAFTRAFTAAYEDTPSRYRKRQQKYQSQLDLPANKEYPMSYKVEICDVPKISLAGLFHQGDYMGIGAAFEKLMVNASVKGVVGPETRSFGVYYDDPATVKTEELRSFAAVTANQRQAESASLEYMAIGGGRHATLTFQGPYAELDPVYDWFYGKWLPNSGEEMADVPPFEEYLNNPREVPANELITIIYLPLKN